MRLNSLKKYVSVFVLIIIMLTPIYSLADIGPKASITVTVKGASDKLCYATLLSPNDLYGPYAAWDKTQENARYRADDSDDEWPVADYDIWKKFVDYKDPDGYYYLQETWKLDENGSFCWSYLPPDEFKILLYFPEEDAFISSQKCDRYAFASYFTMDVNASRSGGKGDTVILKASNTYDHSREIISLIVRMLLTIAIELIIALLFRYRDKRQIRFLVIVNIGTQLILNLILNLYDYKYGPMTAIAIFILCEGIVFIIEAVLYGRFLGKLSEKKSPWWLGVIYAFVANAASFGAGIMIYQYIAML